MIAILTTKTTHHIFFENQIFKKYKNLINIYETNSAKPEFLVDSIFEKKRDNFEKKIFFQNKKHNFKGKSYAIKNINDNFIFEILKKHNIKYLIVFGTRKIKKEIVKKFKNKIFNLHGGNPQEFRGLDSHYWSVYHNNFKLYSCLHRLGFKLDDGDIIFLKKIILQKNMKIHQLRLKNTLCCIQMVLRLIYLIRNNKRIQSFKQKNVSRYYSFMPKVIKDIVEKKFNSILKN
jgi:methionyl-tRNA formyltransferase